MRASTVRIVLTLLFGVGGLLGVLSINASPLTPAAHNDAVEYLTAAKSFARDGTFRIPISSWASDDSLAVLSHYPPGFSAAIAVPIRAFGVPPHVGALWTMAIGAGATLAAVFWIASTAAGLAGGIVSVLLLLATPTVIQMHLAIWSESLYLPIALVTLCTMTRDPGRPLRYGLLAALGVAVRYVGLAGTAAAVAWAARQASSGRERLRGMLLAGAPSAVFLLGWSAYVATADGSIRTVRAYGGVLTRLPDFGHLAVAWLVPLRGLGPLGSGALALALLAAIVTVIGLAWRRGLWSEGAGRAFVEAAGIYSVAYVALVLLARAIADPRVPFDPRLFLPVLTLATMAFGMSIGTVIRAARPAARVLIVLAIGTWCAAGFRVSRAGVAAVNRMGAYYTHRSWLVDPMVAWLEERSGPFDLVYSNEPGLVYFHAGRAAKALPRATDDLDAFSRRFRGRPGAVVIAYPLHADDLPEAAWPRTLGVVRAVQSPQGAVYLPVLPEADTADAAVGDGTARAK